MMTATMKKGTTLTRTTPYEPGDLLTSPYPYGGTSFVLFVVSAGHKNTSLLESLNTVKIGNGYRMYDGVVTLNPELSVFKP